MASLKKYSDYIDYWVSEPDKGIYEATNKGISLCQGRAMGILNSDDFYNPWTVEKFVENYSDNNFDDNSVYYGSVNLIRLGSNTDRTVKPLEVHIIRESMIFCSQSMFCPKRLYLTHGTYNSRYKIRTDWDFLLNLYMQGVSFVRIDSILSNYRNQGFSSLLSYTLDDMKEVWEIRKKHKLKCFYVKESIAASIRLLFGFRFIRLLIKIKKSMGL